MESIKDFLIGDIEETTEEKAKVVRKKAAVSYETVFVSGPDFGIRRKTDKTRKVFVAIVSAGQLYIKDEKTGIVEPLTKKNIATFFNDLEEPYTFSEYGPTWLGCVEKGAKWAEVFLSLVWNEYLVEFIKKDMLFFQNLPKDSFERNMYSVDYSLNDVSEVFKALELAGVDRKEAKEAFTMSSGLFWSRRRRATIKLSALLDMAESSNRIQERGIERRISTFELLKDIYGLDGVRKFIKTFVESPVEWVPKFSELTDLLFTGNRGYGVKTLGESRRLDLDRMLEYMAYESCYNGFVSYGNDFMAAWTDDMKLQETVYGKVREKYPENLLTHHQILVPKANLVNQKIDEAKWAESVERMKQYEYTGTELMIVSPKTKEDMLEEAQQQSNCLAGYVRSVMDGNCMIFFLRRKKAPETSFVTIEIRSDGSLGQVKAKFNKEPGYEARRFVEKWYDKMFCSEVQTA